MAEPERRIVWTEPALEELDEIAAYIALDKPMAASKRVARCLKRVERLVEHPSSGRRVPELRGNRYLEVIVSPCRIVYRLEGRHVLIVHVVRGEHMLDMSRLR